MLAPFALALNLSHDQEFNITLIKGNQFIIQSLFVRQNLFNSVEDLIFQVWVSSVVFVPKFKHGIISKVFELEG